MIKRYLFHPQNWLQHVLITAFIFSIVFVAQAQTGSVKQWDKTFGGTYDDFLTSLQQTSDGGYILGGSSESGISSDKTQASKGGHDYWVVKLDTSGNKTWDKTYGGSEDDFLTFLQQTYDGGYILGGLSKSPISGDKTQICRGEYDYWVVKLDASGNKLWDRTFGGYDYDNLYTLQQTSDGGYILGGLSDSGINIDKTEASRGGSDYWIIKLDTNGNKLWDKTYGGYGTEILTSLQQTSDGGYILGGSSLSGISGDKTQASRGDQDYWVVKLDSSGNKLWDKTYGGYDREDLQSLQQTSDGGYIIGGSSNSQNSGDKTQAAMASDDYWVIKLNSSGNKIWDKIYGGYDREILQYLQQTSDGGFILGGYSLSSNSGDKTQASRGNFDYWVIKLNANGNKIWDIAFGGSQIDKLTFLQQTSDGGYILGGFTDSGISGDKTQACKGYFDYWIVKLNANVTGIKEDLHNQLKLYPNPTSGLLNLELSTAQPTEIIVFNALGQQVLQKTVAKTDEKVQLDLSHAAKGIYLVQVKTENQVAVKKIVVE